MPVLVLRTTGRRSGRAIETPLTYFTDGDAIFIVASKGGDARNPGWFHNLVAQPDVTAIVDGRETPLRAEVVTEESERRRLFEKAASTYSGYAGYQQRTDRTIPVIRLRARKSRKRA